MGRKTWFALALAAVVAVSFAAGSVAAASRSATETRSTKITKALDYLHAKETSAGAFHAEADTAWGILGAVASGERVTGSVWTINGTNPYAYLQANNHVTAANNTSNAPEYYARAIMAYIAVGSTTQVGSAGSAGVDLVAKLFTFQNTTIGSFSPLSSSPSVQDVHTTAWAILALHAVHADLDEPGTTKFNLATSWLANHGPNGDGGFPSQTGDASNVIDTALAIQALRLVRSASDSVIANARDYLTKHQNSDGGFRVSGSKGATDAQATAAAIQAIVAMGESPSSSAWKTTSGNTPTLALSRLQLVSGVYAKVHNVISAPIATTSWALMALRNQSFTTFPARRPQVAIPFVFRPVVQTLTPKNHAKFTTTRIVLIRATYTDGSHGTGVNKTASRLYVDNVNRSKSAAIGYYGLYLELKNLANGLHTYSLHIVDNAGNVRIVQRDFTVAVPIPAATVPATTPTTFPTAQPTYEPPVVTPTPTPTPSTTLYPTSPTPTPSSSPTPGATPIAGQLIPSPSSSASPAATGLGAGGGGGSAGGFLGGTLLAMLPVGAAISFLVFQRRAQRLAAASQGVTLSGGGSAWEHVKHAISKSKDLVKPAGS